VIADPLDVIDECETVDRGAPPEPAPQPVPPPPVAPPPPPPPPTQSRPRAQPRCVVPNVKGKAVARARTLLSARRCRLGRVARAYSRKVKKGRVIFQSRRPGLRLARGTRVNVVVSRGRRG
jgi:PASTA domain